LITQTIDIFVTDQIRGVYLSCDHGTLLGDVIKCYGHVDRGSPSGLTVDFGDGKQQTLQLRTFFFFFDNLYSNQNPLLNW